jgi:hypothetical protein
MVVGACGREGCSHGGQEAESEEGTGDWVELSRACLQLGPTS